MNRKLRSIIYESKKRFQNLENEGYYGNALAGFNVGTMLPA